jgi:hypothetical protein
MFRNILACIVVLLTLNSTASPIEDGIIGYSHSTPLIDDLRKAEMSAMQRVLHEPIELHAFTTSTEVLASLQKNLTP